MIQIKGKVKGNIDQDTYECDIEIEEYGIVKGIPTRFVNEPKEGDEVWCIIFNEVFGNECIYIPLNILNDQFIGMARKGFKIEFTDDNIDITSQNSEIKIENNKIEITSGGGTITLDGSSNKAEISGFSTGVKLGGNAPATGNGPFCGIPSCLFTGAPHVGDTVMGN